MYNIVDIICWVKQAVTSFLASQLPLFLNKQESNDIVFGKCDRTWGFSGSHGVEIDFLACVGVKIRK
jgi:hypothetical protein